LGYIGFTQFYPWVKLFYPVLPNFTQLVLPIGKTHMPTLNSAIIISEKYV